MIKPGAVIFIHGIFGRADTWSDLLLQLQKDRFVQRFFDLELFNYASPKVRFNPLKRIPDFGDVARGLATTLQRDQRFNTRPCVVLVGHSQGGLIIQRFIADAIRVGRADEELARIRGVVLLATPNAGSELFLSVRRAIETFWNHPQERRLRPFDEEIADVHALLLERVIYGQRASNVSRPIRFDVYTGAEDGVVPAHSARGLFPHTGTLPGDHSSIIHPKGSEDLVVRALATACHRALNASDPDATVLRTEILDPENQDDVEAVESLLGDNFLPNQNVSIADFRHWLAKYEELFGLAMRVMIARIDERIDGVLMFHESVVDGLIVVDYVTCRDVTGLHGLLFKKLVVQLRARARAAGISSVVFEVEDPSALESQRACDRARARIRKFEQLGARTIGDIHYIAPDMDGFSGSSENPYFLMHVCDGRQPTRLHRDRVNAIVRFMYTVWYKNWFSRQFADREAELHARVWKLYERVAGREANLPEYCRLEKNLFEHSESP